MQFAKELAWKKEKINHAVHRGKYLNLVEFTEKEKKSGFVNKKSEKKSFEIICISRDAMLV